MPKRYPTVWSLFARPRIDPTAPWVRASNFAMPKAKAIRHWQGRLLSNSLNPTSELVYELRRIGA